jgi:hypothetical protein
MLKLLMLLMSICFATILYFNGYMASNLRITYQLISNLSYEFKYSIFYNCGSNIQ